MKALYALLIFLFLTKFTNELCAKENVTKTTDCTKTELEGDEYRCCYLEYETFITHKSCVGLTEDEYSEVKDYLMKFINKTQERGTEVVRATIYCDSSYLVISILSIILLLF